MASSGDGSRRSEERSSRFPPIAPSRPVNLDCVPKTSTALPDPYVWPMFPSLTDTILKHERAPQVAVMNNDHWVVINSALLRFHELNGSAKDMYIVWSLNRDGVKVKKRTEELFTVLRLHQFWIKQIASLPDPHSVMLDRRNGDPLGRFLHEVCGPRLPFTKGFFVQMHGKM